MSYAGDVAVLECWRTLQTEPSSQLVDVRTEAEWVFVGVPQLGAVQKDTIFAEWQQYPHMQVNPTFIEKVAAELNKRQVGLDTPVFMLCRSGVRSMAAAEAMTNVGYTRVFNVLGGFEGNTDDKGHRGTKEGWKYEGLPWRQ